MSCLYSATGQESRFVVSADFTSESCRFYTQLGQRLDYLHVKLWSVMNFRPASGDENVRKWCNFTLGCDLRVSLIVKNPA